MTEILFPMGVRLSTWIVLAVFLVLGTRDRRYLLAAAAWLVGFELVFQVTNTVKILHRGGLHPGSWWQPILVFGAYAAAICFLVFAARHGARPSLLLIAISLCIWVAMIGTGFRVNSHDMVGFSVAGEVMNEASKTLWALAYLWPLWRSSRRSVATQSQPYVATGPTWVPLRYPFRRSVSIQERPEAMSLSCSMLGSESLTDGD